MIRHRFRSLLVLLATAVVLSACANVIGEDFDNVHSMPTTCNLVKPNAHDPTHYIQCAAEEGCYLDPAGKPACLTSNNGAEGAACQYENDCAPGLTCGTGSGGGIGCVHYCRIGGSDCAGRECVAFSPSITSNGEEYGFCAPEACDPSGRGLAGDGLATCSTQCRFVSNTVTACWSSTGRAQPADACSDDTDCVATASCVATSDGSGGSGGGVKVCALTCRVGEADCGAAACHGAKDATSRTTLNGVEYGYCAP
jgi:hypothetical protein